jgi:hypothetical protein
MSTSTALNRAMMSVSMRSVNLLVYGPVEDPAPGFEPVENLRGVGGVDLVLRQSLQGPYLLLNV